MMERVAAQDAAAGVDRGDAAERPDLTIAFSVDRTAEEAYKAITNVRGWWSENIEGPTDELDGEFIFHNEPVHYSRIKVTELVPGERVAWRILENFMSFVEDTSEWVGNEITFEIAKKGDETEVAFTQIGLVPDLCVLRRVLQRVGRLHHGKPAGLDRHGDGGTHPEGLVLAAR